MNELKINDTVFIQSYKHDGSRHRTWSKGLLIDKKEHELVVVTDHTFVVENDGRKWLTKEPAICFFYDNRWFNVISMVRKNGIYYYCNIASPSLYDGEAIKNIDYDLDVKVYPDYSYTILDEDEYEMHAKKMNYPHDLKMIVEMELRNITRMIENRDKPFEFEYINEYLLRYLNMMTKK